MSTACLPDAAFVPQNTGVTRCHYCNRPGTPNGMWFSKPNRRVPWMRFVCMNDGCRFEFESAFDGPKRGRPWWLVPMAEVTA